MSGDRYGKKPLIQTKLSFPTKRKSDEVEDMNQEQKKKVRDAAIARIEINCQSKQLANSPLDARHMDSSSQPEDHHLKSTAAAISKDHAQQNNSLTLHNDSKPTTSSSKDSDVENDSMTYKDSQDLFQDSQKTDSEYGDDFSPENAPCVDNSARSKQKGEQRGSFDSLILASNSWHVDLDGSNAHTFVEWPQCYTKDQHCPRPYASSLSYWDDKHVRMPFCDKNEYMQEDESGNPKMMKRWDLIVKSLRDLKGKVGSFEIEEAILSYNRRYANKWSFDALHNYMKNIHEKEKDNICKLIPKMIDLALEVKKLLTKPIPLLKKGKQQSLTFSQEQIACLLANAFFCTFPRRNSRGKLAEYSAYPDINFSNLFQGKSDIRKREKLKCIFHYFSRIVGKRPNGLVTFKRQVLKNEPVWHNISETLQALYISSEGTIEDDGKGFLQVDFANKYIGGGVLGHGCVQEEIRFLICPEMIITRLFTEELDDNESLIMIGCERFSSYKGYADTFSWEGNFDDQTSRDKYGHLQTEVVAIDALIFRGDYAKQFRSFQVMRELKKAYCGFMNNFLKTKEKPAVCTGNWGCGAFGGEKQLKALIQLIAAAAAGRGMCYLTFDDNQLLNDLYNVYCFLLKKQTSLGEILKLIEKYNYQVVQREHGRPSLSLFQFIVNDGSKACQPEYDVYDSDSHERYSDDYKANTP